MSNRPHSLYGAAQVRELDRIAIEERHIDGYTLMKRAGEACYRALRAHWPRARELAVLCGGGNNGGDGYVIGRLAQLDGLRVRLTAVSPPKTDSAKQAAADFAATGTVAVPADPESLESADLLVDAMLGTGLERQVGGVYVELIRMLNQSAAPVLAVDVPSGLNGDRGCVMGVAVKADLTATFIGQKIGLFTAAGPEYAGQVVFDDLDVPADIYDQVEPLAQRIVPEAQGLGLPRRPRDAHKGNAGKVLVVGGERGMPGAVALAGLAAYRCGAGLVHLATRADHAAMISAANPELMATSVETAAQLVPRFEASRVIAIGPGLGQNTWGAELLSTTLEQTRPMVVDADALNLLADEPRYRDNWVLTPHPGEAARLLDCSTAQVQADRLGAAVELQRKLGGAVVLKGAGTVVHDGQTSLCDRGNPGMGVGGMGDVLTGVIAGLIAQGLSPPHAARYGVWLHATAGDHAARNGEIGLMASDLLPWLRTLVNRHG